MERDQRKSEDGFIDTSKDRSTTSLGRQSIVSTDREGNVSVSVKPDSLEPNFSTEDALRTTKPRESFNNGSIQVDFDSLAARSVPDLQEEEFEHNCCTRAIEKVHSSLCDFLSRRRNVIKTIICGILIVAYFVYFGFAVYTSPSGANAVIVLTCLVVFYLISKEIWKRAGKRIYSCCCAPIERFFQSRVWSYCRW